MGECCFGNICTICGLSNVNEQTNAGLVVVVPIGSRVQLHSLATQAFNGKVGNVVDVDGVRAKILVDGEIDAFRVPISNIKVLPNPAQSNSLRFNNPTKLVSQPSQAQPSKPNPEVQSQPSLAPGSERGTQLPTLKDLCPNIVLGDLIKNIQSKCFATTTRVLFSLLIFC